jgi:hypothetical protein
MSDCEHVVVFEFGEYDHDSDLYRRHFTCTKCGEEIIGEYINAAKKKGIA